MSKKPNRQPEWMLTDEWGIWRDPYNWTLVYRSRDSESDRWKEKGHYQNVMALIEGWHRKYSRTVEAEPDLRAHIQKCADDVSYAAKRLNAILQGGLELLDEDADFPHIRPNAMILNRNFKRLVEGTGLPLELINVGEKPDDMTGDYIRVAWQKVNRNFETLQMFFSAEEEQE